ncbi:hypothetical protein BTUL_0268g00010 [Botrytis tulipae]|uniref:Uncharacterized protein n=1 Tax=Botrytis tulipae TaxID=87230 RepID=A0A4Z1EDU4_9HELO|nr:hypothetical protein BTUL_0268g00010 [Botrytis tulipae]
MSQSHTNLCGSSETNAGVGGVKDGVVLLQELLSDDGVDTGRTSVVDPGVVLAGSKTEGGVLGGWDQVLCWGEGFAVGLAVKTARPDELSVLPPEAVRNLFVDNSGTGCFEGCSADETAPDVALGNSVNTTEGELAVSVVVIASRFWLEVNTKNLTSDGALNGALSKISWTNTENSIDGIESRSAVGSTNGLRLDGKTAEADNVCVLRSGERTTAVSDRDATTRGYTS